jgi:hypothetical protein
MVDTCRILRLRGLGAPNWQATSLRLWKQLQAFVCVEPKLDISFPPAALQFILQRCASQSPGQLVAMLPYAKDFAGQAGAIGLQLRLLNVCLSHAFGKADDPVNKVVQSVDPLMSLLESPKDQVPSPVKE